ncbi:MAG: polysaccharide deacetylase family protein, partial [Terracidiphilus sp.]
HVIRKLPSRKSPMAHEKYGVILTYHSVGDDRPPLSISLSQFAEQMEWLSQNAKVIRLADLVNALKSKDTLAENSVALTFDDGYADFFTQAAPILRRWGFPAIVFLPTAYCGRTNSWPGQPGWVPEKPLLTWMQVEELACEEFEFGSHSATHPDITQVCDAEAEREITESKREIEIRTGNPAEFFCYPYGRWGSKSRELVSRHFRAACSTAAAMVQSTADPYALPRVDAYYVRNPALFKRLFTRQLSSYIALRRGLRRLRNQPEGHYSRQ